jgi:hypothetical protein
MKKLLEQASVNKDAPKAKSGCPGKDKTIGGVLTSRNECGLLPDEKQVMLDTDSEMDSELKNLSYCVCEARKVNREQSLRLYLP